MIASLPQVNQGFYMSNKLAKDIRMKNGASVGPGSCLRLSNNGTVLVANALVITLQNHEKPLLASSERWMTLHAPDLGDGMRIARLTFRNAATRAKAATQRYGNPCVFFWCA
jgi:hypothetical protein